MKNIMILSLMILIIVGCKKSDSKNDATNFPNSGPYRIADYDRYFNDSLAEKVKFSYSGNNLTEILVNGVSNNLLVPKEKHTIEYSNGKVSCIKKYVIKDNQETLAFKYDIDSYEGVMPKEIYYTGYGIEPYSSTWSQTESRVYFNNLLFQITTRIVVPYSQDVSVEKYYYNVNNQLTEVIDSMPGPNLRRTELTYEGALLKSLHSIINGYEEENNIYGYSDTLVCSLQVSNNVQSYSAIYTYNSAGCLVQSGTTFSQYFSSTIKYHYENFVGNYHDILFITANNDLWKHYPVPIWQ